MRIIGLVPCKLSSQRIPRKNLVKVGGKTLLDRTVEWMKEQRLDEIYVTSDMPDDPELREYCTRAGVRFVSDHISGMYPIGGPYLVEVHVGFLFEYEPQLDYLVSSTPDNPIKPDVNVRNICDYMYANGVHETFTVDAKGLKVGALHIMSVDALRFHYLAGKVKVIPHTSNLDVDTPEVLREAEATLV